MMDAARTNNQTNKEIVSEPFRMGAGAFAKTMIFRYAAVWVVALMVIALVGVAFGIIVDIRWMIVGFMVVFIVIPALLMFFYYSYGLKRECYVNAVNHRIIVGDEGVTARIIVPAFTETDKDGNITETPERMRDEFFSYDAMTEVRRNIKSFTITLGPPHRGFLWIPETAFPTPEAYERLFEKAFEKARGTREEVRGEDQHLKN